MSTKAGQVQHVDADHIGGSLKLLGEFGSLGITIGEIWFNGYRHLDNEQVPLDDDTLGAKQGEQLTALIRESRIPWNARFDHRAVMVPADGPLPTFDVAGLELTLLSPTFQTLQALKPDWEAELARAELDPGDAYVVVDATHIDDTLGGPTVETLARREFESDHSSANGSSIAFLATHDGKTVLFAADAFAGVLLASLKRGPLSNRPSVKIEAHKVSHHGSQGNTNIKIVKALPSRHYLVSSNGAQFEHPDAEAIARIVVHGPKQKCLHFNYKTPFNRAWDSTARKSKWDYDTRYGGDAGLRVEL